MIDGLVPAAVYASRVNKRYEVTLNVQWTLNVHSTLNKKVQVFTTNCTFFLHICKKSRTFARLIVQKDVE